MISLKPKSNYKTLYVPLEAVTDIDDDDDNVCVNETSSLLNSSPKTYVEYDSMIYRDFQNKKTNFCKRLIEKLKILKRKNILTDIKCAIVFINLIVITILISINPEQQFDYHEYSVSNSYSQYINKSIPKHSAVVRLRLRGALVVSNLQQYSNISIIISNMNCFYKLCENTYNCSSRCQTILTIKVSNLNIEREEETFVTNYIEIDPEFSDGEIKIQLQTTSNTPIPIGLNFIFMAYSLHYQIVISGIILLGVYLLIIFDLVHRSIAAILGSLAALATLSTLNLRPSLETIISWLDFDTLNLLFGMMLIVGIFSETGFFDWIAFQAFKIAHGKPWPLLIILCTVSAVVSGFLDNVTTVLLLTPVTIRLCEALKMDPKRVLIAEVLFSNIGGTATAIGDPPNVILVSSKELQENGVNFANFTLHMSVGSVFILLLALLFLRFLYRDLSNTVGDEESYRLVELKREIEVWRRSAYTITIASKEEAAVRALLLEKAVQLEHELGVQTHTRRPSAHFRETLKEMENKYCIKDKWLLIKCSIVLCVVILSFFLSSVVNGFYLDLGWISFFGAIWIIVLSDFANLEVILDKIEWATLIFFAALFALMKEIEELHLITFIGKEISTLILMVPEQHRLLVSIIVVLWISALVSSFIDNIPFTTAMIPIILELGNHMDTLPLVWALAFGACLGGNGTLIGASANVVVAGIAQQHGYSFSFMDFFKIGFPMMLLTTFIAMIYLLVCHILIGWNAY